MPTRKIDDSEAWRSEKVCRHPDHSPPGYRVFEPGTYEHTCPKCGYVTIFVVPPKPTLSAGAYRFVP